MFQLKLEFNLENPVLYGGLDRIIISFMKKSIQNCYPELYEKLYSKNSIKTYTYSLYLPGVQYQRGTVVLRDTRFAMYFSSCDMGDLICFFNSFMRMKGKKYSLNRNSMTLVSLKIQNCKKIWDSKILIKMQSSLLCRKHDFETNQNIYYAYDQADFSEVLKNNIIYFLKKMDISVSTEGFTITPIKGKKIVADVFGRWTDGNIGIYKLTGDPALLNVLYLSGMGARRSEGHGKFEIIG